MPRLVRYQATSRLSRSFRRVAGGGTAVVTRGPYAAAMDDPQAFVDAHEWVFAKTMPQAPHWYLVKGKNGVPAADFAAFVRHIEAHGYDQQWGRSTYRYLELGGFRYWAMGHRGSAVSAPDDAFILNRARLAADPASTG